MVKKYNGKKVGYSYYEYRKYIYSSIEMDGAKKDNTQSSNKTKNTIIKMFLINGFSEEEALKYFEEYGFSNVDERDLVCALGILKTVNLDNVIFFEHPDFFTHGLDINKLDRAVKLLKNSSDINYNLITEVTSGLDYISNDFIFNYAMNKMYEEYKSYLRNETNSLVLK